MRILITGITGFIGGHLTESLRAEGGHALVGLSRAADWPPPLAHLAGAAELIQCELLDAGRLTEFVRLADPDWVFHLAGYADPLRSHDEPDLCWKDNLDGTRALYDAVHRSGLRPRILFVSTGHVYGPPDGPDPQDETAPLRPESPYAASKAAAELLSYQYTRRPGLDIIRVRLFNQIGPRQSADYFTANWARQIAAAEAGGEPVVRTLDLGPSRDLTDIRDMVHAFRLLIAKGRPGEVYNAASGQSWRLREVLDRMVRLARVPVEVREKTSSTAAPNIVRVNARKLRDATGWEPRYDLDRSLEDILNDWRGTALA